MQMHLQHGDRFAAVRRTGLDMNTSVNLSKLALVAYARSLG